MQSLDSKISLGIKYKLYLPNITGWATVNLFNFSEPILSSINGNNDFQFLAL